MRHHKIFLSCGPLAGILAAGPLLAAPLGTAFTYQGRLDQNGQPATGLYQMTFWLYATSSAGNPLASNTVPTVGVTNGLFTTDVDFGANQFTGDERWLTISVATNGSSAFTMLQPRTRIAPTPYALHATTAGIAGSVSNNTILATSLVTTGGPPVAGQVLSYDGSSLTWQGLAALSGAWSVNGNSTAPGQFLGTTGALPLDVRVNNARALRLEPNTYCPNVIGGWNGNVADEGVAGVTIAGGGASPSFLGVGASNRVTEHFGTVGGGAYNLVGNTNNNFNDSYFATIAGGYRNVASGIIATISGGSENRALANDTFVGGGYQNTAQLNRDTVVGGYANTARGGTSTIGGGEQNQATAPYSTIGGGERNLALGNHSAIGGGQLNVASNDFSVVAGGSGNIANGVASAIGGGEANQMKGFSFFGSLYKGHSVISGGQSNTTYGNHETIAGGQNNSAEGFFGINSTVGGGNDNHADSGVTVPGGFSNYALGSFSFAAGLNARANHGRSFVFSSRDNSAPSFADERFQIHVADGFAVDFDAQRPDGGGTRWVYIGRSVAGQQIATSTGAFLSDVGVWQNASDRNRKTGFTPVNGEDILRKLALLPISIWRYTNEASGLKHLGPTAQDFQAAFGLGADDKSIGTVDADGVALAAIQGLNQKLENEMKEKDTRISSLEGELASLMAVLAQERREQVRWEARLAGLEQALGRPKTTTAPVAGLRANDAD